MQSLFDTSCKRLLAGKQFLARIMKTCLAEYQTCSLDEIETQYIETSPVISREPVHQDEIIGSNNESVSSAEGTVRFDIRFEASAPGSDDLIHLMIDLEAQRNFSPGYPLLKRAAYYCGRMISAQRGPVFSSSDYGRLRKVYSIWICLDPPARLSGTIGKYEMTETLVPSVPANRSDYDMMTIIMIYLGGQSENELLQMLNLLFSIAVRPAEKIQRLKDEFHIRVDSPIQKEVTQMGVFSEYYYYQGVEQGIQQGVQQGIQQGVQQQRREQQQKDLTSLRNLMTQYHLTLPQAMDALSIPAEDRAYFIQQLS